MTRTQAIERKSVIVHELAMAYLEAGAGDPIVFLHGNPTSSHLWRNVIPHLADLARCVAPYLIGMGNSDKLADSGPGRYRLVEHLRFLDGFLDAMAFERPVTLVLHDWGGPLGFDWARRHRDAVRGIAYMETIVRTFEWSDWRPEARPRIERLRSPEGERMMLEENFFLEDMLPNALIDPLSEADLAAYRRPYLEPGEARRPTLVWPRELPIDGAPADVTEIVRASTRWLAGASVPKLLIRAEPGAILTGNALAACRRWPNQREVEVPGKHYVPEDSPAHVGRAVAAWYHALPTSTD
jgi:haloalkane dehalogenase